MLNRAGEKRYYHRQFSAGHPIRGLQRREPFPGLADWWIQWAALVLGSLVIYFTDFADRPESDCSANSIQSKGSEDDEVHWQ